jgi:hypothetical protein
MQWRKMKFQELEVNEEDILVHLERRKKNFGYTSNAYYENKQLMSSCFLVYLLKQLQVIPCHLCMTADVLSA